MSTNKTYYATAYIDILPKGCQHEDIIIESDSLGENLITEIKLFIGEKSVLTILHDGLLVPVDWTYFCKKNIVILFLTCIVNE